MAHEEATTRTISNLGAALGCAPIETHAGAPMTQVVADLCLEGSAPAPQLEPGVRFNRYHIEERLGIGGMGVVYRARDELLQRSVALKVILPDYFRRDPSAGLRFLREAEIVARLSHPNVIGLLDAGLEEGIAFMTFELVAGVSLAQRLRDQGPLSPRETVEVLLPVVSAVAYAHAHGVVHGDLKPNNIVLGTDYAGRSVPKVLDFGVSFFASIDPGLDPTRHRVAGTPGYVAPEWLTQRDIDERLDCFSLGCVLYECLTGSGPFSRCTRLSEAALAASNLDYLPPSRVRALPPELDSIVARALAPLPDDRYARAAHLGRDLLQYAGRLARMQWSPEFQA
jgi:serine/threonine-protein kinase